MHIPSKLLHALKHLLGDEHVRTDALSLALNGYDCSPSRHRPDLVLTVTRPQQLPELLALLSAHKIPFIARAAATNHAGGCGAVRGGAVLNLNPLNRLYRIDTRQQFADADPALVTGHLQDALAPLGFFYAPDPASERVSTLGGNLAQNASGARCLKYGNTAENTLQASFLLPDGTPLTLRHDGPGPDWLGLVAGSEGTLGLIEKLRVHIQPAPTHIQTFLISFPSLAASVQTVTDLVSCGIMARCVEAMDKLTAQTIEHFAHAGYPEAEALLLLELDGAPEQIKQDEHRLRQLCHQNGSLHITAAYTPQEREQLWRGRRAAYAAMAALAPNVAVGDGTVPRSELPRTLEKVRRILDQHGVTASLLFHAGDGNFHPQIVFDARLPDQVHRVSKALQDILKACVDAGGTVSGEHGIGVEKRAVMAYQYSRQTLRLFQKIKHAFDPQHLANPEKIIPVGFEGRAALYEEKDPAAAALVQEIKRRFARREKSFITGAGSQVPPLPQPALSTRSLHRVLDIDTTNYTVTAQAGVSVRTLLDTLHAQHLYARLPAHYPGTLGGLIAAKAAPEFTGQLTGLQAILPDGDVVSYGGKVMKNAAGYNLCRLFAGSWGALGLITQVTFKVYALPQPDYTARSVQPGAAADLLFRAVKQEIDPQALFVSPTFEVSHP